MGITIRSVTEADVPVVARIHVDTWRTTYRGLIAQDFLDALSYEEKQEQWLRGINSASTNACRLVAEFDGVVAGFVIAGARKPDTWAQTSELYAMYVRDELQGKGIGSQLYTEAIKWLRSKGQESMLIQVLRGNEKTIAFYEARGAVQIGEGKVELGGQPYAQFIYEYFLPK